MPMTANGLAKLAEELGELQEICGRLTQIIGKKLAWYDTDDPHWDGQDLRQRMVEELGDVSGAVAFVSRKYGMLDEVTHRSIAKLNKFLAWDEERGNNVHGVDGLFTT